MNKFMNKIFGVVNRKNSKKGTASGGMLGNMPENVLYGEDSGAVPPDDFKNQLDDEVKK